MCIESGHLCEDLLQHIEENAFVHFNVLHLALKGFLAKRLAVEAHVVEVSPCIIDDVKAVEPSALPPSRLGIAKASFVSALASFVGSYRCQFIGVITFA